MNILIDIGHPGHVHLLKYTAKCLLKDGHKVYFSVREIPVAQRLMDCYGMKYISLGKKRKSIIGKAITVLEQDAQLMKPYGRIIITSEKSIEPEFEEYRLPVPPEDIHSLMYYSSMFIGDSQTIFWGKISILNNKNKVWQISVGIENFCIFATLKNHGI